MILRLYHRLCQEILGPFVEVLEARDQEYQRLVEAYSGPDQTGMSQDISSGIQSWMDRYNHMHGSDYSPRYYQVLALYFTEYVLKAQRDGTDFTDQKALVYWMATGSGKTLLMHLNILQYIEHIGGAYGFDELQIIMTTPGVNLIQQHEQELGRFIQFLNRECNNRVQLIIETTSSLLNKEAGFFRLPQQNGRYRLVLVDEGHIGLSGGSLELGAFKKLRQDLLSPANSFLFEYSATYHGIADKHVREYENQIVFDYNYYRFYRDGYGKDFALQSIKDDRFADPGREEYENFIATFSTLEDKIRDHAHLLKQEAGNWTRGLLPARPLLAFMGNTVVDPQYEGRGKDEVSDIRKLLRFLAYLGREEKERLKGVFNQNIQGRLRLSRRPGISDLIWLSWGEGGYWGLINVGNGEKFLAECEGHEQLTGENGTMLVEISKANIIPDSCLFEHIDTSDSPVNVLIGSRKFAEGWNCFRVSVIGLINLGATKGNKIIQIFGRGVRLHGQNRDGKRRHPEHLTDYNALAAEESPLSRLRRLETLNIFSLKKSYLETFLKGLEKDLPVNFDYSVPIKSRPVMVRGRRLPFEEYSIKLKAPKVGRNRFQSPLLIVRNTLEQNWTWEYFGPDGAEKQTINNFPINLDYSPDPNAQSGNILHELYNWLNANKRFFPLGKWRSQMQAWEQRQKVQILVRNGNGRLEKPDPAELLSWLGSISYVAGPEERGFESTVFLVEQVQLDVLNRVRGVLVNDINKRNYRMDEVLQQSSHDQPGDFADKQNLHLSCKNESDKDKTRKKLKVKFKTIEKKLRLDAYEPKANFHIYGPLFDERLKDELNKLNILKMESASPPLLNKGESKFIRDLTEYLRRPEAVNSRYEFYLMRNESCMRSVGLYLESELQAFFPDFVLWVVDEEKSVTHILLIDPKGQTGILDPKTLETNEKVNIAVNGHLDELARKMTAKHGREFKLHSFILLRDSSPLGRCTGMFLSPKKRGIITAMQEKNVFRLDWSNTREDGSANNGRVDGKSYLDMMFEKADILL